MTDNAHSTSYPDQKALVLHVSMQYGEPMASEAINRNFHNIMAHGIYEGFECVLAGGLNVTIAGTGEQHTLAAKHDNVTLTVHAQHPSTVAISIGQHVLVVDSFYQFGVQTKQTEATAEIEAAEYKLVTLDAVLPHHIILAEFDVPGGTTTLTESMMDTTVRTEGRMDIAGHVKQHNPHAQYERVDNAATNEDIDVESVEAKHIKLPQFWRGIQKYVLEKLWLSLAAKICPVGVPLPWPTDIAPAGFGIMKGQSFSRSFTETLKAYPSGVFPDMRGLAIVGKTNSEVILAYEAGQVKKHGHAGSSVSSTNLGSKNTNTTGNHVHALNAGKSDFGGLVGAGGSAYYQSAGNTVANGNHFHSVSIGSHAHSVAIAMFGATKNTINNRKFNWIVRLA